MKTTNFYHDRGNRIYYKWNGYTQAGYFETIEQAEEEINKDRMFFNPSELYTIHSLDSDQILKTL